MHGIPCALLMYLPAYLTPRSAVLRPAFSAGSKRLAGLFSVLLCLLPLPASATTFSSAAIASDASVASQVSTGKTYTHAINLNASSTVTVNSVPFGFGTGNGGGSQPAKNYTFSSFNSAVTNFNSTATGNIHTLLATRGTNTNSATYVITLSGLTSGTAYTFALFTDSAHGPGRNWYRVSQNADASTYDLDFSAGGVNSSRLLTASYTATGASVTFTLTRLTGQGSPGVTDATSWIGFAGFVNYAAGSTPPVITSQPASLTVTTGTYATFSVAATGAPAPTFQWKKNGAAVAGATAATYTINPALAADAGSYTVTVTNAAGSVTSNAAVLTVTSRETAERATVAGAFDFNYLLYRPAGYHPTNGPAWPVVIFLHGYGERSYGTANPMDPAHLNDLKIYGPPLRIEGGHDYPFLVVSPQCWGSWWQGAELESFIDWLELNYHIDPSRIYLTGLSMGGFGVWDLCQRDPTRYAAIVPISAAPDSSPSSPNYTLAPALHNLPIWAFHGANDPIYSVAALQSYLDLIRNAGGSPLVTIYTTSPGNGHDAWVPTYASDDWCNWLLTH